MNSNIAMIDIMSGRRNNSDLCWILKDYESKLSYFSNYQSSVCAKKNLLDSMNFKYEIKLLADKTGKTEEQLMKEALDILNGMSHNIGMNSIRLMGYTLSKIIKQIYQKVYVNADQMEKLRNAFSRSNVILLPTHRSYADFLLMSYVMFEFNLPMPVIAAAMDFMNMKLVGELLRGCGAFFIRRSFANDEVYWNVFSHYIKMLIELGQETLEFFIEGTRSRTNKSLLPRIGLLGIVLESWLSRGIDIEIVPISISYDRILEERLYAWELLGVPKPKESTSGLLKVRHILNDDYGCIYFNVADPISISQLAAQFGVRRCHHNLELKWRPSLFDREKDLLRYLGHLVVTKQQQSLVICDWSIVALVLVCERSLTQLRLVELFKELIRLLASWGVPVADSIDKLPNGPSIEAVERVQACLGLHRDLWRSVNRLINVHNDRIDKSIMDEAIVASIQLGNARNPLLFHLARESVLLSILKHSGRPQGSFEAIDRDLCCDYNRVMELLGREFIYPLPLLDSQAHADEVFHATVERLVTCGLLMQSSEAHLLQPNIDHPCYAAVESAVHTHLLAYTICGNLLVSSVTAACPSPPICQLPLAQQYKLIQNYFKELCLTNPGLGAIHLEMCSLDIVKNAVVTLGEMMKRDSVARIQQLIGIIGHCLPVATRTQLPEDYSLVFHTQ